MNFQSELVIERMKSAKNLSKDKELAEYFSVSTQVFSAWKKNNSLPLEKVLQFAVDNNVSLDWLIRGKEDVLPLNIAEKMLLTAFNSLTEQKKLEVIQFVSGLGGQSSTNNVNQSVSGNTGTMMAGGHNISNSQVGIVTDAIQQPITQTFKGK